MEPADRDPSALKLDGGATVSMGRLLTIFLKIGSIGFGGGMAVIALMEQEFVRKRRLIPLDEFVHSVGLGQVLGSFAVNVAIFIGYRLFGVAGALLSAGAFLAPSIALVIILSDLYFRYHAVPALQSAVAGLAPVVIALILDAGWSIGRKVLRSWPAMLIAAGALVAGIAQWNAVWVLVTAGAAGFLLPERWTVPRQPPQPGKAAGNGAVNLMPFALFAAGPVSQLIATFFKIGLVFFGGGFVLVPVLHNRLVTQLGWLKPQEFLDGVAISNLTPGPIAVLATFAGFRLAGLPGALAATVALFAPGIMLMLAISHQYGRFRDDHRAQRFLAGVNPAVAGLILSAALVLGRSAVISRLVKILLLASLPLLALAETPEQQHARIQRLEHAVLAPCCYTQPVAIHQSEVALKMRLEIAKWVAMGKSDQEIIDTYVGLYGGKVLVDPRTVPRGGTPFVPWLVLVLGAFVVAWLLKRWRAVPRTTTASSTTEVPNLPDVDDE